LHHVFRLAKERPHALAGYQARLAAKVGLHNFCRLLPRFSEQEKMLSS
jgi:hypothetical protein